MINFLKKFKIKKKQDLYKCDVVTINMQFEYLKTRFTVSPAVLVIKKNPNKPSQNIQCLSRLIEIKQKSAPRYLLISFKLVSSILEFIRYNIPKKNHLWR